MARTPSAGRRKIEIELIESKVRRQVTLSKRRQGLFNKAHELATLCGVEVAVLVPSLSGNVIHSFGSPNVDHVINRFLDPALPYSGGATVADGENAASRELDAQLAEVMSQATEAKKTNTELSRQIQRLPLPATLPELLEMKKKMEDLKAAVAERIEELSVAEALQSLSSV